MISLDNMLFFIITKKRLLAGVQNPDRKPDLLEINGQWAHSYEGKSIPQVIENAWENILEAYQEIHGEEGEAPVSLSLPAQLEDELRQSIHQTIERLGGGRFKIFFEDPLALSFVHGLLERKELEGNKSMVLEALDDYLHLWSLDIEEKNERDLIGRQTFREIEQVKTELIKDLGPSAGRSNLMSQLIKKFLSAGLTLNLDSQTELAHQLITPPENYTFTITQQEDRVSLEGKASFEKRTFEEIYALNRDKLHSYVSRDIMDREGIKHVFLMGAFFQNEVLEQYLKEDLRLGNSLIEVPYYTEKQEFETILRGLAIRAELLRNAEIRRIEVEKEEAKRREEEEKKKMKVKAELEAKDARESLFKEIQEACVDPGKQEEYEQDFIPKGEQLGIPDVVIKWNISEILSKISLKEEAQTIGIIKEEEEKPQEPAEENFHQEAGTPHSLPEQPEPHFEPDAEDKNPESFSPEEESQEEEGPVLNDPIFERMESSDINGETDQDSKEEEEESPAFESPFRSVSEVQDVDQEKVSPSENEESNEEEPVFVLSPAERREHPGLTQAALKESNPVITLKKEESVNENGKKRFSLGDIFSLKTDLKDKEFITKVVSFKADSVLQTLRLLKKEDMDNSERLEAFKKLHLKEMDFYGNVSDISESKEGLYFYRPYIERNTLKNYLISNGFNKKERVDSLSSNELKFMLMVFKEVRSLTQPHADLNEENIIVQEKRKWSLQKNISINFVGFTSEDVSNNEMVEATHKAFSRVMGDSFYQDFRKKFQL